MCIGIKISAHNELPLFLTLQKYMFSIIIPTWNNLDYLQLCVSSIRKNSAYPHEIILHINDGRDGTLSWADDENIPYTHSDSNVGICFAVNQAAALATKEYIVYMNDDMYVCPGWDKALIAEIEALHTKLFMLSATMIEPKDTGNPCVIAHDYGTDTKSFQESNLLDNFRRHEHRDWSGSAWPPTVVHASMWHLVGGYSIEYSPGYSSDDDFAMKMWQAGCRIFKGIGSSRVYHFQAKSTHKIIKNDGRRQFLLKWGINQSTFNKYYLKRGQPYVGPLTEPDSKVLKKESLRAKLKIRFS